MPWPTSPPTASHRAAYADAEPRSFWLAPAHDSAPALHGVVTADLCIVGGGFTGLWAALYAKALDPARDVVLLEAETAGFGASGRNGGFCVASLTHGIDNGLARFASEMEVLERLGLENFEGIRRRGPHDVGRALARFADEGDGGRRIAVLHVDAGAGIFLLERLRVRRGQILRERRDDGEPVLRLLRSWLLREH